MDVERERPVKWDNNQTQVNNNVFKRFIVLLESSCGLTTHFNYIKKW